MAKGKRKEGKGEGKRKYVHNHVQTQYFPEEFNRKGLTFQTISMQYIFLLRVNKQTSKTFLFPPASNGQKHQQLLKLSQHGVA